MVTKNTAVEVPEGFQLESGQTIVPGVKDLAARITAVPGFKLNSPIDVLLSEEDDLWTAENETCRVGGEEGFLWHLYNEGNSPREAAYNLFNYMVHVRRDYVADPSKFNPSAQKAGETLKNLFEPVSG